MSKENRLWNWIRLLIVFFAGIMPLACARNLIYRKVLGYSLGNHASIGFLTFLDSRKVTMGEGARLKGIFNVLLNVGELEMGTFSKMGSPKIGFNLVSGNGKSKLHLKRGARITWGHFFDLSENITVGEMTIIGGKGCEFFTHDMFNGKRFGPIEIGNGCYIGSSSKFCQGAKVSDRTVVMMGSVITRTFEEENVLLGGVPANVIKEDYGYEARITYDHLNLPY